MSIKEAAEMVVEGMNFTGPVVVSFELFTCKYLFNLVHVDSRKFQRGNMTKLIGTLTHVNVTCTHFVGIMSEN